MCRPSGTTPPMLCRMLTILLTWSDHAKISFLLVFICYPSRSKFVIADEVLPLQVDLGATHNPGVFRHCHDLGNQAPRCRDEITWENLDVKGSILRKPNPCSAQGRSTHHRLIDLEKPAALDDDVEIVSSTAFTSYANHNVGLFNNSQSLPLESSPLVRDRLCSAPYITSGQSPYPCPA